MAITIMIVEDNLEHQRMLRQILTGVGWLTRAARSVEEGFREMVELKPDLIITDIQLEDFTGYELCARVRRHPALRQVPVLMVTGTYHREEDRLRAFETGADAFLLKPFHVAELLSTARALLRRTGGAAQAK